MATVKEIESSFDAQFNFEFNPIYIIAPAFKLPQESRIPNGQKHITHDTEKPFTNPLPVNPMKKIALY